MTESTIIYTHTDEAPALATASLLPIVRAIVRQADIDVETRDISLAARVLAAFSDTLPAEQRVDDSLAELGRLATLPEANIIKLPNISASIPQLKAAIAELQVQGYAVPDFPDEPTTAREREVRLRYDRVKGSAVNPVLREGNSDRRAPLSVKNYARRHPHTNKPFPAQSRTRVATMGHDDFRSNEKSWVAGHDDVLTIRHIAADGTRTILRSGIEVSAQEIVDASFLSARALDAFLTDTLDQARAADVLYSVHLKATMMKVSDPIIFGRVVRAYFADVFARFGDRTAAAGLDPRNGIGALLAGLPAIEGGDEIASAFDEALDAGPRLSYVDSERGITNLHVPSDVIVDASMPALVRNGGRLWGADGGEDDTLAVIPDSSYAGVYQAVIEDVIAHGPLDPAEIGTVPNVGLMAQAAEEYGSHDKTFEIAAAGAVQILDGDGGVLIEHAVEAGDIWRATQTTHVAVVDWVRLAVSRARATGVPAVFWLDVDRAHDAQVIAMVEETLATLDVSGLELIVRAPEDATRYTLSRLRQGLDTISVTGNVLRDYLTDLFPILEVGTSAKMLSIVPLLAGGGLFETGAGGSAPKHVQQFIAENFLRWDSLGEFFALAASLEHVAVREKNARAEVLADTLDIATGTFLENDRSPGRAPGAIDNRGSHYYLALYWAQELAAQTKVPELAARFAPIANELAAQEHTILAELAAVQRGVVDIGGYYHPDQALVNAAMRPSPTLNAIIDALG